MTEQQWIEYHKALGHIALRLEPDGLRCNCGAVFVVDES